MNVPPSNQSTTGSIVSLEALVQQEIKKRMSEMPASQRHIDANRVFQSLSGKQSNQSILQYLKRFNLHHQDYSLSDAKLIAQL